MSADRLLRRPFRGIYFYEWQIGPAVFQVRHTQHTQRSGVTRPFPLVHVWIDRAWRFTDLRFQPRSKR